MDLGACNPECIGFYEKEYIRETQGLCSGAIGGPAGADLICRTELGQQWKALLVGGETHYFRIDLHGVALNPVSCNSHG